MDTKRVRSGRSTAARASLMIAIALLLSSCSIFRRNQPPAAATAAPPAAVASLSHENEATPAGTPAGEGDTPAGESGTPAPPAEGTGSVAGQATDPVTAKGGTAGGATDTGTPDAATPEPTRAHTTLPPGDHLFVQRGFTNQTEGLTVLNGTTGAHEADLPAGIPSPDWSVLYVVDQVDTATRVRALDPSGGPDDPPLREKIIQGDFVLPGPGAGGTSDGLSPDGQWLVLAERLGAQANRSAFAVIDTAFTGYARGVILSGSYRFFAISNDGNSLYLMQPAMRDQSRYRWQLRVYDMKAGRLSDAPLAGEDGSPVVFGMGPWMVPFAGEQRVYGIGDGEAGSMYLYALNLADGTVKRTGLPPVAGESAFEQYRLSLTGAPGGKTLYLVDNVAGSVDEIDAATLEVRRSRTFARPAAAPEIFPTPSARSPQGNGGYRAGQRSFLRAAVLSPDGRTLFVPGRSGLAAIDTADLSPRGEYLDGLPIESLAFSGDGARLYAMSGEFERIVVVDPHTGSRIGELAGVGQSYALLHVETIK